MEGVEEHGSPILPHVRGRLPQGTSHHGPQERQRQLALSGLTFNSAKLVIAMIPMLIVYPFLQRYFVTGVVMGAIKE